MQRLKTCLRGVWESDKRRREGVNPDSSGSQSKRINQADQSEKTADPSEKTDHSEKTEPTVKADAIDLRDNQSTQADEAAKLAEAAGAARAARRDESNAKIYALFAEMDAEAAKRRAEREAEQAKIEARRALYQKEDDISDDLISGDGRGKLIAKSRVVHIPLCNLRPGERNRHFFGRHDLLEEIDDSLIPKFKHTVRNCVQEPQTFVICGLGGVGKTELAREYAFTRRAQFGAIIWIKAGQAQQISDGFANIAKHVNSDFSQNETIQWLEALREEKRFWGSNYIQRVPWLLIFDNVSDLDTLKPFLAFLRNSIYSYHKP